MDVFPGFQFAVWYACSESLVAFEGETKPETNIQEPRRNECLTGLTKPSGLGCEWCRECFTRRLFQHRLVLCFK